MSVLEEINSPLNLIITLNYDSQNIINSNFSYITFPKNSTNIIINK